METIARSALSDLLRAAGRQDEASVACAEAFALHAGTQLRLSGVSTESILSIYRRRFGRPQWEPASVLGSDRFLEDIESAGESVVRFTALEFEGLGFSVWLDESASRVISCMVARDHRSTRRHVADWTFTRR